MKATTGDQTLCVESVTEKDQKVRNVEHSEVPMAEIFRMSNIMEHTVVLQQHTSIQGDSTEQIKTLLSMQTFEGSWLWEDELLSSLGLICDIVAQTMEVQDTKSLSGTLAATALTIKYFNIYLKADMDVWKLEVEKARAWIDRQVGQVRLAELLSQAEELIA
ncbi:hypothetical protein BX616_000724 [Lobosporangium transversale]|uniref:Uncharacterized protein n=1 Tax=Lobosporangium transversale TaxID=64571 RepID=A0A1Y2GYS3_9FUNG|nr:hypothetical protein BCR41DRAFT_392742 [Lobosporangium transversale]KAF9906409.1 hypothetical protein BX616_000724 [Lobosporangium transversale]ORZ27416.1 hypothetical protein BCR41DRAFT_392742 [Lobosporangium transversale]|eukprot:XP_021885143.1 hypothetical protein BCR41DRAFT_392742 [Lobosporangium transversale]